MNKRLMVLGVATALAVTHTIGNARGHEQPSKNPSTFVHAYEAPFKEVAPGASKAVLWGDQDSGPYGAFTRYESEVGAGMHTYPHDTWIVVVHGAYVYQDGAGEKRAEPGDVIRIPGGTTHRSGGDPRWGALYYEESSAAHVANSAGSANSRQQNPKDSPVFVPVNEESFKEVGPGVSKAVLWGDPDEGPYGAFTRYESEFDAGLHTHTNDVWIVVIQGSYVYNDDAGEKRVGPGDFIRIPGGTKHRSAGDRKWGALFYEASNGRYDLVPVRDDKTGLVKGVGDK